MKITTMTAGRRLRGTPIDGPKIFFDWSPDIAEEKKPDDVLNLNAELNIEFIGKEKGRLHFTSFQYVKFSCDRKNLIKAWQSAVHEKVKSFVDIDKRIITGIATRRIFCQSNGELSKNGVCHASFPDGLVPLVVNDPNTIEMHFCIAKELVDKPVEEFCSAIRKGFSEMSADSPTFYGNQIFKRLRETNYDIRKSVDMLKIVR